MSYHHILTTFPRGEIDLRINFDFQRGREPCIYGSYDSYDPYGSPDEIAVTSVQRKDGLPVTPLMERWAAVWLTLNQDQAIETVRDDDLAALEYAAEARAEARADRNWGND